MAASTNSAEPPSNQGQHWLPSYYLILTETLTCNNIWAQIQRWKRPCQKFKSKRLKGPNSHEYLIDFRYLYIGNCFLPSLLSPFWKGIYPKGNKLVLKGSDFVSLKETRFKKGDKTDFTVESYSFLFDVIYCITVILPNIMRITLKSGQGVPQLCYFMIFFTTYNTQNC